MSPSRAIRRVMAIGELTVFFLYELLLANLRLARDIVTPQHYMRPGIFAIPLEAKSDIEIAALANMISLTPGTLSLDTSADRRFLFVHVMYLSEPEDFKRFEAKLLRALR